ncbi:MAG: TetR/AcrR family transcriptional regulator [Acidimicrobiia bacterium]|nr:TetR/AcrR family transcriptional regulator [Acidimicrobiia bacterium]
METRERLVEAMSTSLRQRGYGSTAMKDILVEADSPAGSMYHHFPDGKAQLAVAAVLEVGRSTTEDLIAIIEAAPSVADAAVAFYGALIEDMESTEYRFGCPIGVPSTEIAFVLDAVREAGAEVFASWVDAISSGLRGEGWETEEAERAARFAVSAYEGASTLARATHESTYISDTLEVVRNVLSHPIR